MNNIEQIESAKNTLIGRLFTLGGSALFFIGTLIVTIIAYQEYLDTLVPQKSIETPNHF